MRFLAQDTARRLGDDELMREVTTELGGVEGHYWSLPLSEMPLLGTRALPSYYFDWLQHPDYDDYWERWSIDSDYSRIEVPAMHFTGLYDGFLRGTVDNYVGMRDAGIAEQRLVIWPWAHEPWGPVWGTEDADLGFTSADRVHLAWFDRHLKGEDGEAPVRADDHPVRLYVLHEGWRDLADWPPPEASEREHFLHSGGGANSKFGDGTLSAERPGEEPPDVYVYDPLLPRWSEGGHSCCDSSTTPMGPACQGGAEATKGVLTYTSAPLEEDQTVIGTPLLVLHAATSAADTDFVARLCVVDEEGCSRNLQETLVRARYRDGFATPRPLERGETVEYRLQFGPVAIRVPSGCRWRVDIASSDFPLWDRNLNTGTSSGLEGGAATQVATQTIFHDEGRPSRLVLPVV